MQKTICNLSESVWYTIEGQEIINMPSQRHEQSLSALVEHYLNEDAIVLVHTNNWVLLKITTDVPIKKTKKKVITRKEEVRLLLARCHI